MRKNAQISATHLITFCWSACSFVSNRGVFSGNGSGEGGLSFFFPMFNQTFCSKLTEKIEMMEKSEMAKFTGKIEKRRNCKIGQTDEKCYRSVPPPT